MQQKIQWFIHDLHPPPKQACDTDTDRNIIGCKDAPDSLALPPA